MRNQLKFILQIHICFNDESSESKRFAAFSFAKKGTMHMGNKSNTEIKVLTFYDGETEAIDAFADVIRHKMRKRIRDGKKLKITS